MMMMMMSDDGKSDGDSDSGCNDGDNVEHDDVVMMIILTLLCDAFEDHNDTASYMILDTKA